MFHLTPIQMLLWITALEMITGIVLVIISNIFIGLVYRAKENHIGKIAKAIGAAIEKAGNDLSAKFNKKEEN